MNSQALFLSFPFKITPVFILLFIWVVVWKGMALWKAAKRDDEFWFIALMVINTLGILEIAYIYFFSERKAKKHHKGAENHQDS